MTDLGKLMFLVTSDLESSETAAEIARRYQLRRRRNVIVTAVAGCCVAATSAIAVAGSGVLDSDRDVNQVVPAGPTASAHASATPRPHASRAAVPASILGVDVTWLPAGMSWTHETVVGTSKENGQPITSTPFVGSDAGTGYTQMTLSVQRNFTANLEFLSKMPSQSFEWVRIHGQRALMQDVEPLRHVLTWVDIESKTTIRLEVIWEDPSKITDPANDRKVSDRELVRTAEGITVGS